MTTIFYIGLSLPACHVQLNSVYFCFPYSLFVFMFFDWPASQDFYSGFQLEDLKTAHISREITLKILIKHMSMVIVRQWYFKYCIYRITFFTIVFLFRSIGIFFTSNFERFFSDSIRSSIRRTPARDA